MNIKVCGVTQVEQLIQLDKMEVDYAGLVFDKTTAHDIQKNIRPEDLKALGIDMQIVGRFRQVNVQQIMEIIDLYRLNIVQLDGAIDPVDCRFIAEHAEVIKTIYVNNQQEEKFNQVLAEYDDACDYYCFDINQGTTFPWGTIDKTWIEKPFFIGGEWLQPSDAAVFHRFRHPDFYGVDLNQLFDKAPGIKDTALIMSFMRSIHQVDN